MQVAAKRRWRDYRTRAGKRPVKDFIDSLPDSDAAAIAAGMKDVQRNGNRVARHLGGDIYELRVAGDRQAFRVLYATEGEQDQILLALEAFLKKTQKTPKHTLGLAKRRLAEWRSRARE